MYPQQFFLLVKETWQFTSYSNGADQLLNFYEFSIAMVISQEKDNFNQNPSYCIYPVW